MKSIGDCFSLIGGEEGQDLVEYSLLLAAIVLVVAAAVIGTGEVLSSLWTVANSRLADAKN